MPRRSRSFARSGGAGDYDDTANRLDMIYDATFHDRIAALSGNQWLRESLVRLRSHLHMYRLYHHAKHAAATTPEHVALAEAIAARDPDAAAEAMRLHLTTAMKRIDDVFAAGTARLRDHDRRSMNRVVDAHVHIWDARRVDYPWLDDTVDLLPVHELTDVSEELTTIGVDQIVLVQAADDPADSELMLDARERTRGWPASSHGRRCVIRPPPKPSSTVGTASPWSDCVTSCTVTPILTSSAIEASTRPSNCSANGA